MEITTDQAFDELRLNVKHQIHMDKSIGIQSIGYKFDNETWVCIIYIPINLKKLLKNGKNKS